MDFETLLYIVVTIAIIIFSAFRKPKKNPRQPEGHLARPQNQEQENDIFEEFFRKAEDETGRPQQEIARLEKHHDNNQVLEKEKEIESEQETFEEEKIKVTETTAEKEAYNIKHKTTLGGRLGKEFSLRDGIIYQIILERKYF
jgi:hypothetical protein